MPFPHSWTPQDTENPARQAAWLTETESTLATVQATVNGGSRPLYVTDYGVKADGVTDDYASLSSAFLAAAALGKRKVVFPEGIISLTQAHGTVVSANGYSITCTGGVPLPTTPLEWEGKGKGATTFLLSKDVPRLWDFWGAGNSFAHLYGHDYTVDANNVTGLVIAASQAVTGGGATLTHGGVWTTVPVAIPANFASAGLVYFPATNSGTAAGIAMAARISGGNLQVRNDNGSTDFTLLAGDLVQGSRRDHAHMGNWYFGGSVSNANQNFSDIIRENVEVINAPTMPAATLSTPKSDSCIGEQFQLNGSGLLAYGCKAKNVRINGGEIGFQHSCGAGSFTDECGFDEDCWHDTLVTPTSNYTSGNYLFTGMGWFGHVWARGYGARSGDVSREFDQTWLADSNGAVSEDAYGSAEYSTCFTSPARTAAGPPTTTLSGSLTNVAGSASITALPAGVDQEGWCVIDSEILWYQSNAAGTTLTIYRAMNFSAAVAHNNGATVTFHEQRKSGVHSNGARVIRRRVTAGAGGNLGRGWCQFSNSGLPLPRLVLRDCEYERDGTDFFTEGEAFYSEGAASVDAELKATIAGINYTSGTAQAASVVSVKDANATAPYATINGPKPRPLRLRIDLNASGVLGTGATWRGVRVQAGYWDCDIEVKGTSLFPGISAARSLLVDFNSPGGGIIAQGRVKFSNRVPAGDGAPRGLSIPSTATCTIRFLEVEIDALLQSFSGNATDSNYAPWTIDATNIENVLIRHAMHSIATNTGKAYPRRPLKQRVVTTTATLNGWDELVVCNPAAGFTVTLPNVVSGGSLGINPGEGGQHTIVDGNNTAAANNITVACGGSDTFVDGTTSKVINTNSGVLRVVAAGGKWAVV